MRALFLKVGLVCFLTGAGIGAFVTWNVFPVLVFLNLILLFLVRFSVFSRSGKLLFFIGAVSFTFGIARFLSTVPDFNVSDIGFYRDTKVKLEVEGPVGAEPDMRSDFTYIVINAEKVIYGKRTIPTHGNLLLKLPRYPEYGYGDYLRVTGLVRSPPVLEGYSYADSLAKNDIFAVMYNANVVLMRRADMSGWSALFDLKSAINSRINELFGEPVAGIIAGILLGLRRSIPDQIMNDFNRTGLTHILAISGYNITLLISIFGIFLKTAGRKMRFYASAGGIIFFVLLTGMSASVIRAAVMGGFVLFSVFSGRRAAGMQNLILSAALMVMASPRILLFDMSFQLSFLATLGILLFVPVFEEKVSFFNKMPAFVAEGLSVTLAAQILTFPLILYSFGRFSLISPFTNIIFLPMVPMMMFLAFLSIACSFLFLPVTPLVSGVTWVFHKLFIDGVGMSAALPYASLNFASFPLWLMIICYLIITAAVIALRKPRLARCF